MADEKDPKDGGKGSQVSKNEDGTITVDGKTYIVKESYDEVAKKARERKEAIEKAEAEKAEAEKKVLEEQGKWKELAEKREKEVADMKAARTADAKREAIKEAARSLGAQNVDTVAKLIDGDKITVGEDGTVDAASVKTLIEGLKTDQPYLFGASQQQNAGNAGGGAPAGGSGGGTQTFYRSQLSDSKFYSENRDAILKAESAGAIVDDVNGGASKA